MSTAASYAHDPSFDGLPLEIRQHIALIVLEDAEPFSMQGVDNIDAWTDEFPAKLQKLMQIFTPQDLVQPFKVVLDDGRTTWDALEARLEVLREEYSKYFDDQIPALTSIIQLVYRPQAEQYAGFAVMKERYSLLKQQYIIVGLTLVYEACIERMMSAMAEDLTQEDRKQAWMSIQRDYAVSRKMQMLCQIGRLVELKNEIRLLEWATGATSQQG